MAWLATRGVSVTVDEKQYGGALSYSFSKLWISQRERENFYTLPTLIRVQLFGSGEIKAIFRMPLITDTKVTIKSSHSIQSNVSAPNSICLCHWKVEYIHMSYGKPTHLRTVYNDLPRASVPIKLSPMHDLPASWVINLQLAITTFSKVWCMEIKMPTY